MVNGITAFSIRDALDPAISQKLNYNFDILARAIKDGEVVAVSGKNPPDPRTDESLWYKTDTGDLYLWAQGVDPMTGRPNGDWNWRKLDLDVVKLGEGEPEPATASDGQLFFFDTDHHLLWIYTGIGFWEAAVPEDIYYEKVSPRWWTLQDYFEHMLTEEVFNIDGELNEDFATAVLGLFPDPEIETSGFFTPDTSVIAAGAMQLTKDGNIAMVNMAFKLKSALSTGTTGNITNITIGKIGVGYRPLINTSVIIPEYGGTANINANGSVALASFMPNQTIGTNVTLYIRGTYVLARAF